MNSKAMLGIIGLLVVGAVVLLLLQKTTQPDVAAISSFQECTDAGYPIMESFPEQCATPDGRTFVNETQVPQPSDETGNSSNSGTIMANGCAVAGCSMQLCVSAEEAANMVSTCEFRAEYECYREAVCEPQQDGKCGWTQTAELTACLENPPALE
ncbi:hypothetical protein C4568_00875 [Candidatus Parcubacteria bacterium]|nr:MAG: hypothetical protein C4568_00875 [Candidatus Parcubacteria bacterium]